jgi:hypothetical protein
VSGGSELGQGSSAVGDPKKRLELVALKAAVEQVRGEYAFSQRRACGLMTMAVSSYRYQSRRSDEPLRTRLVSWRGRSHASVIGDCIERRD